jgi:hypothetical protein
VCVECVLDLDARCYLLTSVAFVFWWTVGVDLRVVTTVLYSCHVKKDMSHFANICTLHYSTIIALGYASLLYKAGSQFTI